MSAYYNEHDPPTAAWLRALITAGVIADGEVDTRSVVDVQPADLRGFQQCHFFAGIGGWSYALRLVGWRDDRPVWTGSCPCQPFSAAGQGHGEHDPRDLWPAWFKLIQECRPSVLFGEQVEAAARGGWLDRVSANLEAENYAVGAVVLGAHSVGAFHIRQRLWFVADAMPAGRAEGWTVTGRGSTPGSGSISELADDHDERSLLGARDGEPTTRMDEQCRHDAIGCGTVSNVADAMRATGERGAGSLSRQETPSGGPRRINGRSTDGFTDGSEVGGLGDGERAGLEGFARNGDKRNRSGWQHADAARSITATGSIGAAWRDAEWLPCRDGKARPVEPGSFPLAHGIPARVGRLRGYGNAIVPQVAQAFIEAYCEAIGER